MWSYRWILILWMDLVTNVAVLKRLGKEMEVFKGEKYNTTVILREAMKIYGMGNLRFRDTILIPQYLPIGTLTINIKLENNKDIEISTKYYVA